MNWIAAKSGALLGGLSALVEFFTGERGIPRVSEARRQMVFTTGLVALCAKMAKADGVVTAQEVDAFRTIMRIAPDDEAKIIRLFDLARETTDGFESYAAQLAAVLGDECHLLVDILDGLFFIAKADHAVHERERDYLRRVAEIFAFSEDEYRVIEARHIHVADDPYVVLGSERSASDDDLRARYRQMVRDNHPDLSIAAGLPPEAIAIATKRLTAINAAWDAIAKERGLR